MAYALAISSSSLTIVILSMPARRSQALVGQVEVHIPINYQRQLVVTFCSNPDLASPMAWKSLFVIFVDRMRPSSLNTR